MQLASMHSVLNNEKYFGTSKNQENFTILKVIYHGVHSVDALLLFAVEINDPPGNSIVCHLMSCDQIM